MDERSFQEYVDRCWEALDMDRLYEAYRQSVLVSYAIADQIVQRERVRIRNVPEERMRADDAHPVCTFSEHTVNGQTVYQLSYDGMLPLYFETHPKVKTAYRRQDQEQLREIGRYHQAVKEHYLRATAEAIKGKTIRAFSRSFMYICHFFGNLVIRDLDNRNRGALINAARYCGLIEGDEWEKLEVMESGFLDVDKKYHVSVFITSQELGLKMVEYVKKLYQNGHRFRVEKVPVKR